MLSRRRLAYNWAANLERVENCEDTFGKGKGTTGMGVQNALFNVSEHTSRQRGLLRRCCANVVPTLLPTPDHVPERGWRPRAKRSPGDLCPAEVIRAAINYIKPGAPEVRQLLL